LPTGKNAKAYEICSQKDKKKNNSIFFVKIQFNRRINENMNQMKLNANIFKQRGEDDDNIAHSTRYDPIVYVTMMTTTRRGSGVRGNQLPRFYMSGRENLFENLGIQLEDGNFFLA
jgi:hypothetical protein